MKTSVSICGFNHGTHRKDFNHEKHEKHEKFNIIYGGKV